MVRHPSLSSALLLYSLAVVPLLSSSPPPPLLAYFRSAPAAPSPPTYSSLSLYCSPHPYPLTCCLPAWYPRYSTLFLIVSRFLHLLTSRLLMASPPHLIPPSSAFPSSRSASSSSFLWSRGGCGCPASFWGYHFPGYLDGYACAAPSPSHAPTSAWPPSRPPHPPPPFSLRFRVIQRILCFLPFLLVFRGVIPVSLDSSFGRGFCALVLL